MMSGVSAGAIFVLLAQLGLRKPPSGCMSHDIHGWQVVRNNTHRCNSIAIKVVTKNKCFIILCLCLFLHEPKSLVYRLNMVTAQMHVLVSGCTTQVGLPSCIIVLKLNLARTGPGPGVTFWSSDLCKDYMYLISHLSDVIRQNLINIL